MVKALARVQKQDSVETKMETPFLAPFLYLVFKIPFLAKRQEVDVQVTLWAKRLTNILLSFSAYSFNSPVSLQHLLSLMY